MSEFILGMDGGGSKCKAVLYPSREASVALEKGTIEIVASTQGIDTVTTGSANVFSDLNASVNSIMEAATILCERHALSFSQCVLSAACAGGGIEASQRAFAKWEHPFAQAHLLNDVQASCIAANDNQDCGLLILGTGSCLAVHQNGVTDTFGGHGFLLGDVAGGAWLGKSAIQSYLQHLDGIKVKDPLFSALSASIDEHLHIKLEDDAEARHAFTSATADHRATVLVEHFANAPANEFAYFAKVVLEHTEHSALAHAIMNEAIDYLVALIQKNTVNDRPLFIDGGLAGYYRPLLERRLGREIERPKAPAEYGAYLYAIHHE